MGSNQRNALFPHLPLCHEWLNPQFYKKHARVATDSIETQDESCQHRFPPYMGFSKKHDQFSKVNHKPPKYNFPLTPQPPRRQDHNSKIATPINIKHHNHNNTIMRNNLKSRSFSMDDLTQFVSGGNVLQDPYRKIVPKECSIISYAPNKPRNEQNNENKKQSYIARPVMNVYYNPMYQNPYETGGNTYRDAEVFASDFDDDYVRKNFVRRVFCILSTQLLITVAIVAIFIYVPVIRHYLRANQLFTWVAMGIFLVIYCTLVCCPLRRKFPLNLICLYTMTLAAAVMVGGISVYYKTYIVLIAVAFTTIICLAMVALAFTSIDFTKWFIYLFVFAVVVLLLGLAATLMFLFFRYIRWLDLALSALSAFIHAAFMLMELQMILGGRSLELSAEEYVAGALMLYTSIIGLFLNLLNLTSAID